MERVADGRHFGLLKFFPICENLLPLVHCWMSFGIWISAASVPGYAIYYNVYRVAYANIKLYCVYYYATSYYISWFGKTDN